MPPRNHRNWLKKPNIESLSSEIYSSQEIYEQEIKNIFAKCGISTNTCLSSRNSIFLWAPVTQSSLPIN